VAAVGGEAIPLGDRNGRTEPTALWMGVFFTSANDGGAHVYFDNVMMRRRPF
ncbi:MAG: hypothetical protein JWM74_6142, partial [Myxococcaceae bacterium]|nr:hypothetical protein [Myxococcaceae bacterium]